ncbi:Lycopene beta cyclase [Corynebacterium faecale]|uniref:lycopene cyclase family protein n=1 Tax=Corynebacterium faecale TaxID=1758466 RepID=UPI0025B2E231|nr:lycopene cyclase family protein [Corynebacterium faecale]WJY92315.1 Lycopene beta cyclase [Corynebacterium faecale]
MKELYDVAVLGLGPSGAVAAHRAAQRGLTVLGIDNKGVNAPSTVGLWAFQLPDWFPAEAVASRFTPSMITQKGRQQMEADYVILKTGWEQHLDGFDIVREKARPAVAVTFGGREARPRLRGLRSWFAPNPHEQVSVMFDDSPGPDRIDRLLISVPETPLPARQLARGTMVPEAAIPPAHRSAVLMDFSPVAGFDEPGPITFSYRVPLGDGTWLIEETILATTGSPSELLPHLKRKNLARMEQLGIAHDRATGTEVVNFALGPYSLPANRPRTRLGLALSSIPCGKRSSLDLRFLLGPWGGRGMAGEVSIGSAGGWMHPATGYSVGEVLAGTDRMLDRVFSGALPTSKGWRVNHHLRRMGLNVLLRLSPTQFTEFFSIVLSLPEKDLLAYLTGTDPKKTARVMMKIILREFASSPSTAATVLKLAATTSLKG